MPALTLRLPTLMSSSTERFVPDCSLPQDALLTRPATSASAWAVIIDDLKAMYHLQDDWDGNGACPPDPATISFALDLARRWQGSSRDAPNMVVPTLGGGVSFEWRQSGLFRELELLRPGYGELMTVVPNEPTRHQELSCEHFHQLNPNGQFGGASSSATVAFC
jgi:hypothetical protein